MEVDIENSPQLLSYLRDTARMDRSAIASVAALPGGVSNRTVLVHFADGTGWVLKQALAKLRVADDWYCHPGRIEREALGLQWLNRLAPGAVPRLVFEDPANHVLAMTAVPQPHANWKSLLLAGEVEPHLIGQFGRFLAQIHKPSPLFSDELRQIFSDRTYFDALRLEPYYRTASRRNPETTEFFDRLISETCSFQQALVHGDYSPKNVLIHEGRIVLLDFEVMHFGDPAFDLGFSLTHLLSKAHHLSVHRSRLLNAAKACWQSYAQSLPSMPVDREERAVRHTLGCLLARVDGRSPLEYFTTRERDTQRKATLELMRSGIKSVPELIDGYGARLASGMAA